MTRRPSAPRLIDWTGERCVPWAPDVQVVYEHFHRYLWARAFAGGKAVLDLGSGEGFGAAILAESAASVVGVDLDPLTVEHARLNYPGDGVSFAVGDATALSADYDGRFDVVVAFEILEHVRDQAVLLAAVRRVLRPDGVLIVSTPNRLLRASPAGVQGFRDVEFTELLGAHFGRQAVFSQRVAEGSRIDAAPPRAEPEPAPLRLERLGEGWAEVGPPPSDYLLAVATDGELPPGLGGSTLLDHSLELLQAERRGLQERLAAEVKEHEAAMRAAVDARDAAARADREALHADTNRQLGAVEAHIEHALAQRDEAISDARGLAIDLIHTRDVLELTEHERDELRDEAARIDESVSWRIFQRAKRDWHGPGPRPRLAARVTGALLRALASAQARRVAAAAARAGASGELEPALVRDPTTLTVPSSEVPDVSIVIPVHNGADITAACLRSIVSATVDGPPYEVIVVDDCADAETKQLLASISGLRVIENATNLGFLRSVNRGVEHALGATVVLLNNDTEPQPGWLPALVDRIDSAPQIGAAGGRLIYPDGTLQEAGGVIFADGSAINYGNGRPPGDAAFRYPRPVDYCSAALLAVKTDVWRELGGFDELFSPGYYEDVDLCFRLRALGYELWFEPHSQVIHKEGGSHGTDVTKGIKRHQVINQDRFLERWAAELTDRPPTADVEAGKLHADRRSGPVVLIVDHIVPEPDRDAGSLRMMHLIRELIAQGARVIFMPSDRQPTRGYADRLEAMGVEILDHSTELRSRFLQLKDVCRLAILSRPQVASPLLPEIRAALPNAQVMYDTVDLHWVREQARRLFEDAPETVSDAYREIELALVRGCDMTAVVTDVERAAILAEVPDADVRLIPVVQDIPALTPGRDGRDGLLFVGGFRHHPNVDAAAVLADEIVPRLRARQLGLTLTLVGPDVPPEIEALAGDDIVLAGWVEFVEPLLDGALAMVAPLRYGAGMKGKVGQALARGLPVITTAVGAQGFGLVDGENALLAESPEEFAAAIERLQNDPALWSKLAAAGPEVVRRSCSVEMMTAAVTDLLATATGCPQSNGSSSANSASVGAPASRSL